MADAKGFKFKIADPQWADEVSDHDYGDASPGMSPQSDYTPNWQQAKYGQKYGSSPKTGGGPLMNSPKYGGAMSGRSAGAMSGRSAYTAQSPSGADDPMNPFGTNASGRPSHEPRASQMQEVVQSAWEPRGAYSQLGQQRGLSPDLKSPRMPPKMYSNESVASMDITLPAQASSASVLDGTVYAKPGASMYQKPGAPPASESAVYSNTMSESPGVYTKTDEPPPDPFEGAVPVLSQEAHAVPTLSAEFRQKLIEEWAAFAPDYDNCLSAFAFSAFCNSMWRKAVTRPVVSATVGDSNPGDFWVEELPQLLTGRGDSVPFDTFCESLALFFAGKKPIPLQAQSECVKIDIVSMAPQESPAMGGEDVLFILKCEGWTEDLLGKAYIKFGESVVEPVEVICHNVIKVTAPAHYPGAVSVRIGWRLSHQNDYMVDVPWPFLFVDVVVMEEDVTDLAAPFTTGAPNDVPQMTVAPKNQHHGGGGKILTNADSDFDDHNWAQIN